ncbi:MAG: tryptophan synthase subunit alpha [bacterium]
MSTPLERASAQRPGTVRASVMTHLVLGYPTPGVDEEIARALVQGGASFLEVQFPYSDPTADGPAIQEACRTALDEGFRVDHGFEVVRRLTALEVPIFVMCYAGLAFARGIGRFVADAAAAGARGLIVPDLPVDSDEGLYRFAREAGLTAVPVTVATAAPQRLDALRHVSPEYLYVALRAGTTGGETILSPESISFLERARDVAGHVMGGFGIRSRSDVEAVTAHCDTAVVGSAIVRAVRDAWGAAGSRTAAAAAAKHLVRHLVFGESVAD